MLEVHSRVVVQVGLGDDGEAGLVIFPEIAREIVLCHQQRQEGEAAVIHLLERDLSVSVLERCAVLRGKVAVGDGFGFHVGYYCIGADESARTHFRITVGEVELRDFVCNRDGILEGGFEAIGHASVVHAEHNAIARFVLEVQLVVLVADGVLAVERGGHHTVHAPAAALAQGADGLAPQHRAVAQLHPDA